jgi:RNA polymerase sigma factor (sigma-70 family)
VKRREEGLARGAGRAAEAEPGPVPSSPPRTDRSTSDRSAVTARRELAWPDTRLVRECVRGDDQAWAALLEKYKNLIFSIPVKQGIPREDAADVFQRVCLLLMAELPHLREAKALPMWLIRVTSHECLRWRRQEHPYAARATTEVPLASLRDEQPLAEQVLAQVKDEQVLREAIRALPERCRQLVEMLFYETPARPYGEIARALGLAPGSIGFIRGRCLTRLRRELERMGFR